MTVTEDVPLAVEVSGVVAGWVLVEGCRNGPSPEALQQDLDRAATEAVARSGTPWAEARRAAVRNLLRHGTYRPTGRAKPASEYLLRVATEGQVPRINVLADLNNLVSLQTLLPISIVDLDRATEDRFRVRRGRPEERYVFNPSGQVLDLEDLLLVATRDGDRAIATPVKDCQATKTDGATTRALAVIYGPSDLQEEVREATRSLADGLLRHAGGSLRWGDAIPGAAT